ncbi:two component sensor histidine kinase EnvZ [Ameyamaea chiangmaiensis NBRC 103196]|nr:two component sensor histidine kinase EnvZ [Ameyamaea chiangmaiensis NBRC 103196]
MPGSFLGRALLIVLVPLLVTQSIALELYYGNFLSVVSRRLSDGVTGEVGLTIDLLQQASSEVEQNWILERARQRTLLTMGWEPGAQLHRHGTTHVLGPMDDDLTRALAGAFGRSFFVDWSTDARSVHIRIQLRDGVLDVEAPRKRLLVGPIWLFVAWEAGSSAVMLLIAALVMRNQVRAIRRLARAAEAFGMGRDPGEIRPEGAQEVRKAAVAFNRMQARILRFVTQRTTMLAGVSHDLRTPLTRLRLGLAMLPTQGTVEASSLKPDIADMEGDVAEMERMIGGYLAFARGEGAEVARVVDVAQLLHDAAAAAMRAGSAVTRVDVPPMLEAVMRPDAMRRVLLNLAENARRHAGHVAFAAWPDGQYLHMAIDDDGPGIPPEQRERFFRPFAHGEGGNSGLGLSIARDIVRAHGGEIGLGDSPLGGLRVWIRLPL